MLLKPWGVMKSPREKYNKREKLDGLQDKTKDMGTLEARSNRRSESRDQGRGKDTKVSVPRTPKGRGFQGGVQKAKV